MECQFKFDFEQTVTIGSTKVKGTIESVCQDKHGNKEYCVRYVSTTGVIIDQWVDEKELEA